MRRGKIQNIKRAFERRLRTDPVMRARFEAGLEEAKSGKGKTYTLAELERLMERDHE